MAPRSVDYLARLEPRVRRWLHTPDPGPEDGEAADRHFDRWLLRLMAEGELLEVGGVKVDRALCKLRFRCVPGRCSPEVERGALRSCCADLTVYLTPAERGRLRRHARALAEHLLAREPRLRHLARRDPEFFLDPDKESLSRPGQRCVCSRIMPDGRIRCHLHELAERLGVDRTDIQPVTCRLFPLVLVDMPRGGVLVTVNDVSNHRAWGGRHPRHFPCLSDSRLPRVVDSMADTLDWLFGPGFAHAVREAEAASR